MCLRELVFLIKVVNLEASLEAQHSRLAKFALPNECQKK